ncbi:MAG: ABC transporter ATP-binding protein [Alphaproteobacteria bacterium]|nr:ABC transporter ATP-binding protein [Alphaproteobacteria bacterium]
MISPDEAPCLKVENLDISIGDAIAVARGVNLEIRRGETVALVGESGSGKTVTALSLIDLLPPPLRVTRGTVSICGQQVTHAPPEVLNRIRGNRVGMIFQQPSSMLDPSCRVGRQVGEALRLHKRASRGEAFERAIELLREVGIPEAGRRARSFAHQLSGGMAQRVMIAAALSGDPDLLIADEPTTALDVTVQAQILGLLERERKQRTLSILLITHDLSIVSAMADRVVVMYAGSIVEEGPVSAIMQAPQHPYTKALIDCSLMRKAGVGDLESIPGTIPSPAQSIPGCRFHPRCPHALARREGSVCASDEPTATRTAEGHLVHCWAAEP